MRSPLYLYVRAAFLVLLATVSACSDKLADRDKDGEVSDDERTIAAGIKSLPPMKPGLWQIDVKFYTAEVTGFSERKKQDMLAKMSRAASSNRCLSEAAAKNPPASFYGGEGTGQCRYRSFNFKKGKANVSFSCARDNMATLDTDLSGTSGAGQFDFITVSALRLPMIGKVDLHGTATGRYVGPCDTK